MRYTEEELKEIQESAGYCYALSVVKEEIVAGEYIKLACLRYLNDFEREDLVFKYDKFKKAQRFISLLKHYKGKSAGKLFILEPWQQWVVQNLVCWYCVEDDTRRFHNAYILISRKNGKTALCAALALYFMFADDEPSSEVILGANSRELAHVDFDMCSTFAKQLDPEHKTLHFTRNEIKFPINNSYLKTVSAESSKLDGLNVHAFILDEYEEAKTSKLRDVLRSSLGYRSNPIGIIIQTAGFNLEYPSYQLRCTLIEVLKGVKTDDQSFAAIYELDKGDDWLDENVWVKSNPMLDLTCTKKSLRGFIQQAINNPSEQVGVMTKNLNIWCQSSDVWIPSDKILDCTVNIDIGEFKGRDVYMGIDLSATLDITAVSICIPPIEGEDKFIFKTWYYLPNDTIMSHPNREMYKDWLRRKMLIATPGNVLDYDYIFNDIMKLSKHFFIVDIFYDKWNALLLTVKAEEAGLPFTPFSQTLGNFNLGTKEIERAILSNKVLIDNNECTRWMFNNVNLKVDHMGNCKPTKGDSKYGKIDGVIAMIEALSGWLYNPSGGNIFVDTIKTK